MREPSVCGEVRHRFARHGLPADRIERVVGKLNDHWQAARAAALERGVTAAEAAARSDARLGAAGEIAAQVIAGLRQSSWWRRHPVLASTGVPVALPVVLIMGLALALAGLDAAVALAVPAGAHAQDLARIEQVVQAHVSDSQFMGAVLVARGPEIVLSKATVPRISNGTSRPRLRRASGLVRSPSSSRPPPGFSSRSGGGSRSATSSRSIFPKLPPRGRA